MNTRIFVSINIRSLGIYFIAILFSAFVSYSIIISDPYLLIMFAPVMIWVLVAFYFILFSRVKFTDNLIIIRGDFVLEKDQRIQKGHVIQYNDINYCQLDNLSFGFDSNHDSINLKYRSKEEYRFFYGYDNIKCITFYMKDESKKSLIINRYSDRQINDMYYILNNKNINISEYIVDQSYLIREKYPFYLRIVMILTMLFFIGSSAFSQIIGGSSINGLSADKLYENYVYGNYYVGSHGSYNQVTYSIWLLNLIVGYITIILFIVTLVLHVIHRIRNRN